MPWQKRSEFLKLRNEKLYPSYCDEQFRPDNTTNGLMQASVLLHPNQLHLMMDKKVITLDGRPLTKNSMLTKEAAIDLLKKQPEPSFFGL